MANPLKYASYRRKTTLLVEDVRNDRAAAEQLRTELTEKFAGRKVTVKVTSFRSGPRPGSRPGVTRQAYSYVVRAYEKDAQ